MNEMTEIPGCFPYCINDNGEVFNNGRKLKPYMTKDNYWQYTLIVNGRKRKYLAHRLVALTFIKSFDPVVSAEKRIRIRSCIS